MLQAGRLHLSGIAKLAPVLTEANCDELLERATHKTKKKIEALVAEVAPQPDVPSTMRKLPAKREASTPTPRVEPRPDVVDAPTQPEPATSPRPAPAKPAVVEPLAPSRYRIQFTASAELHEKLERLSSLMPGVDLASVVEAAVTEKLERVEAKRFGKTKKPRKSVEDADTSPGSRYISAPVKRFVWERDGGRCTDLNANGRRCTAREGLEYHHDDPYGFGGDRTPENVRLLCKVHNALRAERDFGKDVMDQYRRSDDRVSEPLPVYYASAESFRDLLGPGGVAITKEPCEFRRRDSEEQCLLDRDGADGYFGYACGPLEDTVIRSRAAKLAHNVGINQHHRASRQRPSKGLVARALRGR